MLIIELTTRHAAHRIQIFITLQTPPLHRLPRANRLRASTITPLATTGRHTTHLHHIHLHTAHHPPRRTHPPIVARIPGLATIIRTGALVLEPASAATDGAGQVHVAVVRHHGGATDPASGHLDSVVAEVGEAGEAGGRDEAGCEAIHGGHVGEVETAWGTALQVVVVGREVAVAVGVGARGGDVSGIEDVAVDEVELGEVSRL